MFAAPTPDVDPLCRLSVIKQVQVCSSVLTSTQFDEEVDYVPDIDEVSTTCAKKKVVLAKSAEKSHFEEWMIQCVAISSEFEIPVTYYLSRGYSSHKVFVFIPSPGSSNEEKASMIVESLGVNVRNVHE